MILTETDAREYLAGERPLYNRLQHRDFNGDGRTTVPPYNGLHVLPYYNGRTDRASLQDDVGDGVML